MEYRFHSLFDYVLCKEIEEIDDPIAFYKLKYVTV